MVHARALAIAPGSAYRRLAQLADKPVAGEYLSPQHAPTAATVNCVMATHSKTLDHGRGRYVHGSGESPPCRCPICREANRRYLMRYRHNITDTIGRPDDTT